MFVNLLFIKYVLDCCYFPGQGIVEKPVKFVQDFHKSDQSFEQTKLHKLTVRDRALNLPSLRVLTKIEESNSKVKINDDAKLHQLSGRTWKVKN